MIRTWDGVEFAGEQAAHDSYISMEKYIVVSVKWDSLELYISLISTKPWGGGEEVDVNPSHPDNARVEVSL